MTNQTPQSPLESYLINLKQVAARRQKARLRADRHRGAIRRLVGVPNAVRAKEAIPEAPGASVALDVHRAIVVDAIRERGTVIRTAGTHHVVVVWSEGTREELWRMADLEEADQ